MQCFVTLVFVVAVVAVLQLVCRCIVHWPMKLCFPALAVIHCDAMRFYLLYRRSWMEELHKCMSATHLLVSQLAGVGSNGLLLQHLTLSHLADLA